jgi:hypothetical protein
MADLAQVLMSRYVKATERLASPKGKNFERDRIVRLRADIDAFRRDLKYLDEGGKIILAPDSAEIDSYLDPSFSLGLYCFPIEDRATFDLAYARSSNRGHLFDKNNETRKIGRRILRARAHLFNSKYFNVLLPPYLGELDIALSLILSKRRTDDLDAVFQLIVNNISKIKKDNQEFLEKLGNSRRLSEKEQNEILDAAFDCIVANPLVFSDDLSLAQRENRVSKLLRANDFLNKTKSFGIDDYDWEQVVGQKHQLIESLQRITPHASLLQYIENLFYRLPSESRTTLGIYADAQALAYVAAINEKLHQINSEKIKVQIVSWALSPATVARCFWPEEETSRNGVPGVEVRHPKLLAAAIDFDNVERTQVEADLERFSEALTLYEKKDALEESASRDEPLREVKEAWGQLDDTLLAWGMRIGSKKMYRSEAAEEPSTDVERIQRIVNEHRAEFERHLVGRIDQLSKNLSDSHWSIVQPDNVGEIRADCLFYEPGSCIVVRPQADHARFAIAIYNRELVELIHRSFEAETQFGKTLIELANSRAASDGDTSAELRAEIQLLKAFLFAVRDDNILAARYCQLARAELAQSPKEFRIRTEIFYLAHYAYREMGRGRHLSDAFLRSLRMLEDSQANWAPNQQEPSQVLRGRYFVSWITTFREIAASEIADIRINERWKKLGRDAYEGCLSQLSLDIKNVDRRLLKLQAYQAARAAQNVMLAFIFEKLNIGTWRKLFSEIIRPKEEDARRAWRLMAIMRESPDDLELPQNMRRNDFAYYAGSYWFDEQLDRRNDAWSNLLDMEAAFQKDAPMQRVVAKFIRNAN